MLDSCLCFSLIVCIVLFMFLMFFLLLFYHLVMNKVAHFIDNCTVPKIKFILKHFMLFSGNPLQFLHSRLYCFNFASNVNVAFKITVG